MNQDLKTKIIDLIENNAVANESLLVAQQYLHSIRSGHFQGITADDIEADRVGKIYRRRRATLQISGKEHEGLENLLAALSNADYPIKIAQFAGQDWNTTIFLDSRIEKVVGLIAIEPRAERRSEIN